MTNNQPILITGCGRSGASMVAEAFALCGAFTGGVDTFQENIGINQVVESFLHAASYSDNCQYPLPETSSILIPHNWATRVQTQLKLDGYTEGPWVYKGVNITVLWPIWKYAFPNAKWVIVCRRTADIVSSYCKTNYKKTKWAFKNAENVKAVGGTTERDGWLWLVHQYERRFIEIMESGADYKVVWPERMAFHDYGPMQDLIAWAGLQWNSDIVAKIGPKFQKTRKREGII